MRKIELETSVDKFLDVDQKTIPSGTNGTLIDVIIESGTVRFLLDFEAYNYIKSREDYCDRLISVFEDSIDEIRSDYAEQAEQIISEW